jgi:hypothetical protein
MSRRERGRDVSEAEVREVVAAYAGARHPGWRYAALVVKPAEGLPQESLVVVNDGPPATPAVASDGTESS